MQIFFVTMAEGSFYIKTNNDICFSLRTHDLLFESFKIIFNTKVNIDNSDNYAKFKVSSIKDIEKVILSSSNLHPLIGYKLIQYNYWLEKIKESSRYSKIMNN